MIPVMRLVVRRCMMLAVAVWALGGVGVDEVRGGDAAINTLNAEEKREGWQLLFDGRSTEGWRGYRKPGFPEQGWDVVNGMLHKIPGVRGGDIVTTRKFEDFELAWEWKLAKGGNNGIKYLVTEDRQSAPGHEYQMIDDEGHPDAARGADRMTASFYEVLAPAADRPVRPAGEWNQSRIVIKGQRVEHWLNGRKVLEYELGSEAVKKGIAESKFKDAAGFGTKIVGHIMITDHSDETWLRNIKIRELK